MEALIEISKDLYVRASNRTDSRVADYPLVGEDPRPVLAIIGFYLFFIVYGKKYMENRAAFNVPVWILFSYNFSLVVLSVYIVQQVLSGAIEEKYDILCQRLSTSTSPGEMRVVNALWWYFISKIFEFFDTVLMVLRKKNNQISFLHVFHHASILFIEWIVFTSIPAAQSWFGAGLNSFVHIVMYFYYALSVIPSLKDSLWWKKYLTYFQLVQFILTFSHSIQGIILGCDFPMWAMCLQASFCLMMFALFSNFFLQQYTIKNQYLAKKKLDASMKNEKISSCSKNVTEKAKKVK